MRVLHSSDLHGKYKRLLTVDAPFDVWLDTGDFLENLGRKPKTNYTIEPNLESAYQAKWWRWKDLGTRLAAWLDGRPVVTVAGNHDFLSLGSLLSRSCPRVYEITPEGVEVLGFTWAGFREVPRDIGEWKGEVFVEELEELAARTVATAPDIAVTHARPAGVLESHALPRPNHDLGLPGFDQTEVDSPIRYHFFGHEHSSGGRTEQRGPTLYVNGACHVRIHEIR